MQRGEENQGMLFSGLDLFHYMIYYIVRASDEKVWRDICDGGCPSHDVESLGSLQKWCVVTISAGKGTEQDSHDYENCRKDHNQGYVRQIVHGSISRKNK